VRSPRAVAGFQYLVFNAELESPCSTSRRLGSYSRWHDDHRTHRCRTHRQPDERVHMRV